MIQEDEPAVSPDDNRRERTGVRREKKAQGRRNQHTLSENVFVETEATMLKRDGDVVRERTDSLSRPTHRADIHIGPIILQLAWRDRSGRKASRNRLLKREREREQTRVAQECRLAGHRDNSEPCEAQSEETIIATHKRAHKVQRWDLHDGRSCAKQSGQSR